MERVLAVSALTTSCRRPCSADAEELASPSRRGLPPSRDVWDMAFRRPGDVKRAKAVPKEMSLGLRLRPPGQSPLAAAAPAHAR